MTKQDVVTFCMSDGITTRVVTRRTASCSTNNAVLCPQSMSALLMRCHNSHYILHHTAGVAQLVQCLGCGLKFRPIVVRLSAPAPNSLLSWPSTPAVGPRDGAGLFFFHGVKTTKLAAHHSPISSADDKNEWSLTCTPTQFLYGVDKGDVIASVVLVMQYAVCLLGGEKIIFFYFAGATAPPPSGPGPPQYRGFTITLRYTTLGRTPLDEWSARRRDLYLTTHNTHNRHPCPSAGFEPAYQKASGRRPTPLATGISGNKFINRHIQMNFLMFCWPCSISVYLS